jgi:hypothetical protein
LVRTRKLSSGPSHDLLRPALFFKKKFDGDILGLVVVLHWTCTDEEKQSIRAN